MTIAEQFKRKKTIAKNPKRQEIKQAGIAAAEYALQEYQERNIHAPQGNDQEEELILDFLIALHHIAHEYGYDMARLYRTAAQYQEEETPPSY